MHLVRSPQPLSPRDEKPRAMSVIYTIHSFCGDFKKGERISAKSCRDHPKGLKEKRRKGIMDLGAPYGAKKIKFAKRQRRRK